MNQDAVIKFQCEQANVLACTESEIEQLEQWRKWLVSKHLLGQDPGRYGGLAFGNVSQRMVDGSILVTGSQTGHLESLTPAHYARVIDFDPGRNWVRFQGQISPSSETLTHLAVYRSDSNARFVFHTHSPKIWHARRKLNLPTTHRAFECGTVELFNDVLVLLKNPAFCQRGILAVGGHEDGIVSWGRSADVAGSVVWVCLKAA